MMLYVLFFKMFVKQERYFKSATKQKKMDAFWFVRKSSRGLQDSMDFGFAE